MRVAIAAVGRWKAGPERDLFAEYIKRLPWTLQLVEVEEKRALNTEERKAREAELLLGALPASSIVVALDERGKNIGSEALAAQLGKWRDEGGGAPVGFVIGGADGLHPNIFQRAQLVLSFGALTWPHMMVRPMLAEQIYRAYTILVGHPYHRV